RGEKHWRSSGWLVRFRLAPYTKIESAPGTRIDVNELGAASGGWLSGWARGVGRAGREGLRCRRGARVGSRRTVRVRIRVWAGAAGYRTGSLGRRGGRQAVLRARGRPSVR